MATIAAHVVLLWLAVFVGLDLAFGDGTLTDALGGVIEESWRWICNLFRGGWD